MKAALLALAVGIFPVTTKACDVALVLGIDNSNSIDNGEFAFQVAGLAEALADPVIADTLAELRASLAVVQWSGVDEQEVTIPWTRLTTRRDVAMLSTRMRFMGRAFDRSNTAVGDAMLTMINLFKEVPDCRRRVIDFSGDGINNAGPDPREARAAAEARGITVNGLAIDRIARSVTKYFRQHVIVGKSAFVMTATGYRDYPRAIKAKLFRELLPPTSWLGRPGNAGKR